MTRTEFENRVMLGEDSKNQFKSAIKSPEQLAAEMVAFSNSNGGIIYVGVADDGARKGALSPDRVHRRP